MDYISNVFVNDGGTDVITLSVYNQANQYDDYKFKSNKHLTGYIPGEKPERVLVIPTIPEEATEKEKADLMALARP